MRAGLVWRVQPQIGGGGFWGGGAATATDRRGCSTGSGRRPGGAVPPGAAGSGEPEAVQFRTDAAGGAGADGQGIDRGPVDLEAREVRGVGMDGDGADELAGLRAGEGHVRGGRDVVVQRPDIRAAEPEG